MRLVIVIGSHSGRRWHDLLVDRLRALPGTEVSIRTVNEDRQNRRIQLEWLLRLERRLNGVEAGMLSETRLTPSTDNGNTSGIVIDLTDTPEASSWTVHYDGSPGEMSAVDALRGGRFPVVSVVDSEGVTRAIGRPGSEQPGLLATALPDVGVGVSTLVLKAVTGSQSDSPIDEPLVEARSRKFADLAARRVVSAAVRRVYRILYRTPHWRVGWRRTDDRDIFTSGELAAGPWQDLPDDGYRFFADPFPIEYQDRTYLFVEDFDHRDDKGVISVVEWGDIGPIGLPRPVLTHDVHLSYPNVFEHDNQMWMIPETSGARTIELYRAVRFPWEWELHSVLVEHVQASDATVFQHQGFWWMMATVGFGGSLSDSLCLWSAPGLEGPWTPHRDNPVLVDIASARPAGRVVQRGERLLRPVQDCRNGYGAALGVAEILRLDTETFHQQVISSHSPGEFWAGTRLHTFNIGGGLETIDGSRLSPRFWRAKP